MLIVLQVRDLQIFQSFADNLFYWQGLDEYSSVDSPKGYQTFAKALEEAVDALEEFDSFDYYYGHLTRNPINH